jgi:transcriptional regulator GlxA family with amidase domain
VTAGHGLADAPPSDMIVVVASLDIEDYRDRRVLDWLRRRRDGRRIIAGISNGPLLLARAGLLKGRRATVHWESLVRLTEEFPDVRVTRDLYCTDRDVMTAAGGTASMDMMLALISERDGRDLAADVAEQFLHGQVRDSNEMQRQDVRWRYQVNDRRLVTAIRMMEAHIRDPLPIAQVSDIAGLSERQMERLFESALGKSPSRFYLDLGLKAALGWLFHSTETLEEIAARCGFSSPGHFSRAFKACYDRPPSAVRRRHHEDNVGTMQENGDAT